MASPSTLKKWLFRISPKIVKLQTAIFVTDLDLEKKNLVNKNSNDRPLFMSVQKLGLSSLLFRACRYGLMCMHMYA